ncbi:hypothetical protein ACNJQJ_21695, partial [Mycobacterium tuberculosis]
MAELAKTAGLQPIPVPAGTEPGYRPSVKLAAFVRARDLTCRAPLGGTVGIVAAAGQPIRPGRQRAQRVGAAL